MPQVTVYVRKDDLPIWQSIDNKAEFLSRALNGHTEAKPWTPASEDNLKSAKEPAPIIPKTTSVEKKIPKTVTEVQKQLDERCKGEHYMSRKDCGKPGCPWAGVK